ncbi:MAG: NAD(P)-dependent oxidoreductase [candidate division KSB1 bacterium]|nr:NAD(P)-dependent oxidoreductase [candidate division KSB1 bacterium]MDZ7295441.1 NAD(P)-dependent oxidoreductase [candidate division KSB1 bacterium]MDZ7384756.1 NAD(P)-dependent oxidoreductase [candidate division KSB1 bacterium]MDZ7391279.1 NAD(P)-dependent oxidoreductase [candidate division KSB1 bacterium]MDZ7412004.1 NAD(P)-dependent oxidoreductase [candidate division KSB1 bacterium]
MKALVTGAGGFIGSHLVERLAEKGHQVVALDLHFPPELAEFDGSVEAVTGDFRDETLMRRSLSGCDVVFHLASAHLQSHLPDSEYWAVNVHGLQRLLEWSRDAGVERFVHTSTVGVYGHIERPPATEETECRPQSIYGETKLAGERAALQFGRDHGLPVVVLRPAWVYGLRCRRTERLLRMLGKGRFVKFGPCRNLRHPVYIEDMLDAFELAAHNAQAVGEVFIVADEQALTTSELLAAMCEVLRVPEPKLRLPLAPMHAVASLAEAAGKALHREPPFSRRSLEFFTTNNAFDISKARQVLGFAPKYTFHEGVKATVEAMRVAVGNQRPLEVPADA